MLDIAAFPIAVALTLWDALPIYLSVGLALSILIHTVVPRQALHTFWDKREGIGFEGLIYLVVVEPRLALVLAVVSVVTIATSRADVPSSLELPSQGRALSTRTSEIFAPLLVACAVAALVKLAAPYLPSGIAIEVLVATAAGVVVGNRSGIAAVPAVAIAAHLGGFFPGALCIIVAAARPALIRLTPAVFQRSLERQ